MCEDRILRNTKLINYIDSLILNFQKYLLNEYIRDLKENHEIYLYLEYSRISNFLNKKNTNYVIDCLKKENFILNFMETNPLIENQWLYQTYKNEIENLSKKFLLDIINRYKTEIMSRYEFIELLEKLKSEFKIRDKIKDYKKFLTTAKKPRKLKKRNLEKLKKIKELKNV